MMLSLQNLKNLSDQIENLNSIEIFKQLNKSWQLLSHLRVICYHFPNSDLFLNILVTKKIQEEEMLYTLDLTHSYKEISLIKNLWDKPFNDSTIATVVSEVTNSNTELSLLIKIALQHAIVFIQKTDHDPIIKQFLFHVSLSYILPEFPEKNDALRILDVLSMHYLGFLDHPLIYPDNFILLFQQLIQENQTKPITEQDLLFFLYNFQQVCVVGTAVLTIYQNKCEVAIETLKKDSYLEKLFDNSELFAQVFQWPAINISSLMQSLNWKRDKTARFLAKLVELSLLKEVKLGKDKIFINKIMTDTFANIRQNQQIQQIINAYQ